MSDKLPMSREQIAAEVIKLLPHYTAGQCTDIAIVAEHIIRIGTTELREENKRLRSGEFICKKCGLRKDADNFFQDIPF